MHFRSVLRLLALIQLLIAAFMLIPLALSVGYGEPEAFDAFARTIGGVVIAAVIILLITRKESVTISAKDSYLLVTLTWVFAAGIGAVPLYLTGTMPTYVSSYFEIMSGFTTTGATALPVIEDKMKSILFWRNMTNWLGGMGIVVLFVAIRPFMGIKGMNLANAEMVGPTKDKLTPKIQQTAFALWAIYVVISFVQVMLLWIKIPLFDAVTVMFGTMGAAGFTPKNASIGGYHSPYVDVVCIVFMLLAGANFSLYFKLMQGKVRQVARDAELRNYLAIVTVFTLLITLNLMSRNTYGNFLTALRYAAFHVVSIITTTGFSTYDYNFWPAFSKTLLIILFFIGGCAGSTGGGIKVVRISALMTLAKNSIRRRLHPSAVLPSRLGDTILSQDTIISIAGFTAAYILTGFVGTLLLSLSEYDFETCFSASFQFLGNIGIGMGDAGPAGNFSIFSDPLLAVASFLMLVGRLELFTVYALFTRSFWKK